MSRLWAVWSATFLPMTASCNRPPSDSRGREVEAYLPDAASVAFDLESSKRVDGSLLLRATYKSQGKTAHSTIELGPGKASTPVDSPDFPIKTGEGKFIAEAGSDASVLLADLQKALEAKKPPGIVPRSASLPFTFANLGDNQSQVTGGGFGGVPRGNWTAMKIFIGEGDQEAEVFLNFNLVMKIGQFVMKDPEYGDLALRELAKVL